MNLTAMDKVVTNILPYWIFIISRKAFENTYTICFHKPFMSCQYQPGNMEDF